jgi:hypothetical protein
MTVVHSAAGVPTPAPSALDVHYSRFLEFSEGMTDRARRSTAVSQEQAMARHGRLRNLK